MKKTSKTRKSLNSLAWIIIILSIIALCTSIYLIYEHFATGSSVCDFGETVSCSLVNSSIYSEIFQIPVAALGALWSIALLYTAWHARKDTDFYLLLLLLTIIGTISVAYFIWAEFMLQAICLFCTVIHVITLISLGIALYLWVKLEKKPKWNKVKEKFGIILLSMLIGVIILFLIFNWPNTKYQEVDDFAKCINEKGFIMYGSFRCGLCAKERETFGDSFQYITEIECHPQGKNSQTTRCLEKNIAGTPTWIQEINGKEIIRVEGYLSLEELSTLAGCELK